MYLSRISMSKPRFGTQQKHEVGERWLLEQSIHNAGEELISLKVIDCIQAVKNYNPELLIHWKVPWDCWSPEIWEIKGLTDLFLLSSVHSCLCPSVAFWIIGVWLSKSSFCYPNSSWSQKRWRGKEIWVLKATSWGLQILTPEEAE